MLNHFLITFYIHLAVFRVQISFLEPKICSFSTKYQVVVNFSLFLFLYRSRARTCVNNNKLQPFVRNVDRRVVGGEEKKCIMHDHKSKQRLAFGQPGLLAIIFHIMIFITLADM